MHSRPSLSSKHCSPKGQSELLFNYTNYMHFPICEILFRSPVLNKLRDSSNPLSDGRSTHSALHYLCKQAQYPRDEEGVGGSRVCPMTNEAMFPGSGEAEIRLQGYSPSGSRSLFLHPPFPLHRRGKSLLDASCDSALQTSGTKFPAPQCPQSMHTAGALDLALCLVADGKGSGDSHTRITLAACQQRRGILLRWLRICIFSQALCLPHGQVHTVRSYAGGFQASSFLPELFSVQHSVNFLCARPCTGHE